LRRRKAPILNGHLISPELLNEHSPLFIGFDGLRHLPHTSESASPFRAIPAVAGRRTS
jgi:hypothetical protein